MPNTDNKPSPPELHRGPYMLLAAILGSNSTNERVRMIEAYAAEREERAVRLTLRKALPELVPREDFERSAAFMLMEIRNAAD